MISRVISRYGDRALLVDSDDPVGLSAAARELPGVVDAVPGARAVVVVGADAAAVEELRVRLPTLRPAPVPPDPELVVVPVVYDGPDLAAVATTCGLTVEEVVRLHAGSELVVAFPGFVPGFAYLRGLDPRLHLPRRTEPRASVPAGSVALAGGWSGVYPMATPGGWHLIGRTELTMWSLDREPAALLRPGVRVRFQAVT